MEKFVRKILDKFDLSLISYADVRLVDRLSEFLLVKNGAPSSIEKIRSIGFGVRVLIDGAWGFASSFDLADAEIDKVLSLAIEIAKASALVRVNGGVQLAKKEIVEDHFKTTYVKDPFQISLDQKIKLLLDADEIMRQEGGSIAGNEIKVTESSLMFLREHKIYADTEGSFIVQERLESGGGIVAKAAREGEFQVRSYPANLGGNFAQAGYEFIESLKLKENAARVALQARQLLEAPAIDGPRKSTLILEGSQLALQVHESIGHPTELDRVFGTEASYAGTSFLKIKDLDQLRYGSDLVNVTSDATIKDSLGGFGYDDEGVPGQRFYIIENGLFRNFQSSRETAAVLGQRSNGTMRADGWNRIPLIRMTTISLEPGESSLEEMIQDTKEGFYLDTNKCWSIDDRRENFQFTTEVGFEIKNGKLGKMVKNPTYTGITTEFWSSCDAIANRNEWRIYGLPNCGKGQPGQLAHVAHGTAPARFRNIKVGV